MISQNDATQRSISKGDVVLQIVAPEEDDVQYLPPEDSYSMLRRRGPSTKVISVLRVVVLFLLYVGSFVLARYLLLGASPAMTRVMTKGETWVVQPNSYLFWQLHFLDPNSYTSTYIFDSLPKLTLGGTATLIESDVRLPKLHFKTWHRRLMPGSNVKITVKPTTVNLGKRTYFCVLKGKWEYISWQEGDACETKVDISHDLAALEYTVKEEEEYFFVLAYETEEHGTKRNNLGNYIIEYAEEKRDTGEPQEQEETDARAMNQDENKTPQHKHEQKPTGVANPQQEPKTQEEPEKPAQIPEDIEEDDGDSFRGTITLTARLMRHDISYAKDIFSAGFYKDIEFASTTYLVVYNPLVGNLVNVECNFQERKYLIWFIFTILWILSCLVLLRGLRWWRRRRLSQTESIEMSDGLRLLVFDKSKRKKFYPGISHNHTTSLRKRAQLEIEEAQRQTPPTMETSNMPPSTTTTTTTSTITPPPKTSTPTTPTPTPEIHEVLSLQRDLELGLIDTPDFQHWNGGGKQGNWDTPDEFF